MSNIITKSYIRAKARASFEAGKSRDSHGMQWDTPWLSTWLAEYDRLDNLARLASNQQQGAQ